MRLIASSLPARPAQLTVGCAILFNIQPLISLPFAFLTAWSVGEEKQHTRSCLNMMSTSTDSSGRAGKPRPLFTSPALAFRVLWLLARVLPASPLLAHTCSTASDVVLNSDIKLSAEERRWLNSLPPLRVGIIPNAPPLTVLNEASGEYRGISIDVFCFIARELGLNYELTGSEADFASLLQAVQQGELDMLMPLSRQREREPFGLFTRPYFSTYYAVIALKGPPRAPMSMVDLQNYRVGVIEQTALAKELAAIMPATSLQRFSPEHLPDFYRALREGEVDFLVHNRDMFTEDRYSAELFDMEVVQTLTQFPRNYGFYFSKTAAHARLVELFDRYLEHIDASDSIIRHEVGEQRLVERYLQQRGRLYLQRFLIASIGLSLLLLFAFLWHYRRLNRKLDASHQQVLEQQLALLEANQKLEKLSMVDSLTGLANRRQLDERLALDFAVHRRTGAPLSVLMLDLDHFKQVNDNLGHGVGDQYLQQVANELIRYCRRPGDLLARYGGEEMACLLPETPNSDAAQIAERMREAVAELRLPNPNTEQGYLTLSVGVATLNGQHSAPESLLVEADAQLYQAKRAGRNRVCPEKRLQTYS